MENSLFIPQAETLGQTLMQVIAKAHTIKLCFTSYRAIIMLRDNAIVIEVAKNEAIIVAKRMLKLSGLFEGRDYSLKVVGALHQRQEPSKAVP